MRYLINSSLFLVLGYSFFSPIWAQESMDFYWNTFVSGYGFTQSDYQIELYQRDNLTKKFTSLGKVQFSEHYSAPTLWFQKDEHLYGFSLDNDFVRVHSINWHTMEYNGPHILHPKLSQLFDQQTFFIPQGYENGVVLISPTTKSSAVIDFEANIVFYNPIPPNIGLDSFSQLKLWLANFNPKLGQSTYAYRGIDLMRQAFSIIGIVLMFFLAGVGLFFFNTRRTFMLNQKELSNRFKKIPLTLEMYHFLKHLAQEKSIRNQTTLHLFQDAIISEDAKIKRKNKMIGELSLNIYNCFKMNIFSKQKDMGDSREVIYKLLPGVAIKVTQL